MTTSGTPAAIAQLSAAATSSANPSWDLVKQVHDGPFGGFTAITAISGKDAWAFHGYSTPTAWERKGKTWAQVPFPGRSGEEVVAAAASSPRNVWAFTDQGQQSRAVRWDGRAWVVQRSFAGQIGGALVISPADVWVFGETYQPGGGLGAWHYDGRAWSRVPSGHGLEGGSALSGTNIWAFGGPEVAHWNGHAWSRKSLARLLPPRQKLNFPTITGMFARSPNDVYAIGSGNAQDEGGPTVILHYNGHTWAKVAGGYYGVGTQPVQRVVADGQGGLWVPMPGVDGRPSYLLRYESGHLRTIALPLPASRINIEAVALIPGSTILLAGGFTHASGNPGSNVVGAIYEYRG